MAVTAEAVAKVVADLRDGRWRPVPEIVDDHAFIGIAGAAAALAADVVVDVTAVHFDVTDSGKQIALYEDHPCIAPPWPSASFCFTNRHGNVLVMVASAAERESTPDGTWSAQPEYETMNPVEWADARWVMTTLLFLGGRDGEGTAFPTIGPLFAMQFAIAADGAPLDLHWVDLRNLASSDDAVPGDTHDDVRAWYRKQSFSGAPSGLVTETQWDMALCTLLRSLSLLNCANVDIVDYQPASRHERRRLERTGVRTSTIHVFPAGKRRRSGARGEPYGVAFHGVRAHFSHYGPKYGRGLLFGKYEGRFLIKQHARGSRDHGEVEQSYVIHPEQTGDQ